VVVEMAAGAALRDRGEETDPRRAAGCGGRRARQLGRAGTRSEGL